MADKTLRLVVNISCDCEAPAIDLLVNTTEHGRWRNPNQQKTLKFKYWGQCDLSQVRNRARERALVYNKIRSSPGL